jgi:hypothetical protein
MEPINEMLFRPPAFQFTKEDCVPLSEYKDFNFQGIKESDFT